MTAAHYIALLLLSTVAEYSPEHLEIIQQNGEGIWVALYELSLVEPLDKPFAWRLSERGRALVEHILDLPLPEQVTSWRMPAASVVDRALQVIGSNPWPFAGKPVRLESGGEVASRYADAIFGNTPSFELNDDNDPPPPKPPPPKPIPGITPAEDPQARRAQALELINRGYGTSEIADTLEMARGEVEQIFFGGA